MHIELTKSQIGLLNLCETEPGPNITEMYEFGETYGVNVDSIKYDFPILLSKKLVWPVGFIDREIYLPTHCLITEKGKNLLTQISKDNPEKIPDRVIGILDFNKKVDFESINEKLEKFSNLDKSIIQELADTYLYWAELGNTGQLRIPDNELAFAAALGYYNLDELNRFSKAISIWYKTYEKKGDFLNMAILTSDAINNFPQKEDLILKIAVETLNKAYWDLTGETINPISSKEEYTEFLKQFVSIAIETGKQYNFRLPNQNPLIGISNRIEDILGESFRTSNKSLYLQTIHLLSIYLNLLGSIVELPKESTQFEENSGYYTRLDLGKRTCLLLERKVDLIFLQDTDRKKAYKITLEILRTVIKSVGSPVWDICDKQSDNEDNKNGHWIFNLLRNPETKIRYELIELFKELDGFLESATKQRISEEDKINLKSDLEYIKNQVDKLDDIGNNIEIIENVKLPEIENYLTILLSISINNHEQTKELCSIILKSDTLIKSIDERLNVQIDSFKEDINGWIQIIKDNQTISENDKASFLKELGDVMKLSSSSKVFASIPLIPGFLKFQHEINLKTDWNNWFKKLKELFVN